MRGLVRVLVPARARVGEGPFWDAARGVLHWVDILGGQLFTSDTMTGVTVTRQRPNLLGAAAPCEGGFVLADQAGFATITEQGADGRRLEILASGSRMNDAKCDSEGRLWAGSTDLDFAADGGRVHVLTSGWQTHVALEGLTLPNGMGWSPDDGTFYLVDSVVGLLLAYDFDATSGQISRPRELARFTEDGVVPDGLCVDSAGYLWVAMWGGSRVDRLTPDGTTTASIALPVRQPSSCAFGGTDLDVLYITSASEGMELDAGPESLDGSVLAVDGLGVTGLPVRGYAGTV